MGITNYSKRHKRIEISASGIATLEFPIFFVQLFQAIIPDSNKTVERMWPSPIFNRTSNQLRSRETVLHCDTLFKIVNVDEGI